MTKVFRSMDVEKITYSAGTLKTRELPLTVYRGLSLKLAINHDNAAGATLTAKNVCDLIQNLSLVINGQDTLVSLSGYDLYILGYLDNGILPLQSIDTTSDTADLDTYLYLYLPFALQRAMVPEDTLLDVRGASSVVLQIQWASGAGTGVTINSCDLEITTLEYDNVASDAKFARHEFARTLHTITATGDRQEKLPTGGGNQYRRLILTTTTSSTLSDAVISTIGLRARTYYWQKIKTGEVKARNAAAYGVTPLTGVYMIDLTTDGKMAQRIDAINLPELVFEFNSLVSSGEISITYEKAIYR